MTDNRRAAAGVALAPATGRRGVGVTGAVVPSAERFVGEGAPSRELRDVVAAGPGEDADFAGLTDRGEGEEAWTDRMAGVRDAPVLGGRDWDKEARGNAAERCILRESVNSISLDIATH